jgi:hypothetical protein
MQEHVYHVASFYAFQDVDRLYADCLAMPHLAHMAFAAVVIIVFITVTLCLVSAVHYLLKVC